MQFKAPAEAHKWTSNFHKQMASFICGKPVGDHVLVTALVTLLVWMQVFYALQVTGENKLLVTPCVMEVVAHAGLHSTQVHCGFTISEDAGVKRARHVQLGKRGKNIPKRRNKIVSIVGIRLLMFQWSI